MVKGELATPLPLQSQLTRCEMATYNYIKPHWANGQKAVHDAPYWVVANIDSMLADKRSARKDGLIRIRADYGVGLRVA